jgi:hypothetical protein
MVNNLPFRPHRCCLKKTGPGDVTLIAADAALMISTAGMPYYAYYGKVHEATDEQQCFVGRSPAER